MRERWGAKALRVAREIRRQAARIVDHPGKIEFPILTVQLHGRAAT
jgi:hypothetical protein